jgi:hypothetical protein
MLRLLASVAATFSWLVSIVAGTVSAIGDTLSTLIAYATNALRAVTGCIASNAVHLLEYVAGSLERMGTYLSFLARDAVVATWAHVASGTRWLCAAALHAVSTAWAVVRAPGMWLLNLLTTFIHELQKVLLRLVVAACDSMVSVHLGLQRMLSWMARACVDVLQPLGAAACSLALRLAVLMWAPWRALWGVLSSWGVSVGAHACQLTLWLANSIQAAVGAAAVILWHGLSSAAAAVSNAATTGIIAAVSMLSTILTAAADVLVPIGSFIVLGAVHACASGSAVVVDAVATVANTAAMIATAACTTIADVMVSGIGAAGAALDETLRVLAALF